MNVFERKELTWWDGVPLLILILILIPWMWNFEKLLDCDFKPDYRCEVIHGLGLFPPAAFVTVWFEDDGGDK